MYVQYIHKQVQEHILGSVYVCTYLCIIQDLQKLRMLKLFPRLFGRSVCIYYNTYIRSV